ncbi:gustatory receptor 5a for trehalose-like [Helicoverpa zea]|uniref:gustatory receptor 5a for trehalose-like n=1 Tax=Helicoverpa zea TaxID=7113 RepID=UPI001F5AD505|nr:gustatory receptor 5a for trehalose-like [Helicoverpa zea]
MGQTSFRRNMSFWIPVKKNKVDVAKPKVKNITSFQDALRVTVIIGQVFSLLPFVGVFTNVASNVKFVKTSWKCVYSLLSLIGQMFMAVLCINKLAKTTVSLNGTSPVIFYVTTCVTMMLFFQVARRWPALVQHISKAEDMDPNFDCSLTRKCNITCAVVLILALCEHILSLLSAFAGASACYSGMDTYEGFVTHFYPWVFTYLPYSVVLGVLTQFLHFQSTFIWNFSDLFVICMSYYLTSRLEQVNRKLLAAQGKYLPEIFWRATREDYCRATQIVRKVDEVISGVVFISFANNLFFICLQLFNTLEDGLKGTGECTPKLKKIVVSKTGPLGGHEAAAYFLFSLVYLLSRSVAVSLIASQVNSASSVPAPVLYDVPSPVYCVEVQRFLDQVNGDKVALSGLQFFSVTRGLLLTVAGTIVTYELVMFQFNSSTPTLNITSPTVVTHTITTLAT